MLLRLVTCCDDGWVPNVEITWQRATTCEWDEQKVQSQFTKKLIKYVGGLSERVES